MKKIKEAIINADPRMKGLLVVMIAYIGIVATTLNAGATNQKFKMEIKTKRTI